MRWASGLPSVTLPMLGHLHELAAQFYRATPWTWFRDQHPFAIQIPPEEAPRYAIVMGQAGEVFALSVYDTLDDLQLVFSPALFIVRCPGCRPGSSSSLKRRQR